MWADMGYQGRNLKNHIKEEYDIDIEIVKRPPCRFWVHKDTPPELLPTREQGFKVQPRRWVVERTFAWVNGIEGYRRSMIYSQHPLRISYT